MKGKKRKKYNKKKEKVIIENGKVDLKKEEDKLHIPSQIWLIAIILICLKGLPAIIPFIFTLAPKDVVYLPIGYIPKDWFQYTSLIHECAYSNSFFLYNPFTIEAQDGRFILLFHRFLGLIHSASGANVFWLLEFSRIPLIFLFMIVLWKFSSKILNDKKHCLWACWLVAFSGGLEFFLIFAMPKLNIPQAAAKEVYQQLWPLYGWNTFESLYNPLWIASLILLLIFLELLFKSDNSFTIREFALISLEIIILWFVHPYSGLAAVMIFLGYILVSLFFSNPYFAKKLILKKIFALLFGLLIIALVVRWQMKDPVFKRTSGSIFGVQDASIFWYPLTYGLLLLFFIYGFKKMMEEKNPWLFPIAGWVIVIMILHSSPIMNGYKFVMYLHIPMCITAAPALSNWLSEQKKNILGYIKSFIILILIFISAVFVTQESVKEVKAYGIPSSWLLLIEKMKDLPAGNVLAPMAISNVLPSFTPHRVFNGHWFMTPDSDLKARFYETIMQNPSAYSLEIINLINTQKINYIIHPAKNASELKDVLKDKIKNYFLIKDWVIFIL